MSLPSPRTGSNVAVPDPREFEEFEGALIELAQRSGGDLRKLLSAFFSFLHRRTDFYCVAPADHVATEQKSIGFKEGDAEKLLLAAFRQFPLRRMPSLKQQQAEAQSAVISTTPEIRSADSKSIGGEKVSVDLSSKKNFSATKHDIEDQILLTEEGLQIPVGNGGSTDRYKWTQTLEECTVLMGIPEGIGGKDLTVSLLPSSILIRSKAPIGEGTERHTFLEGELAEKIVPSESTWSLEGGVLQAILYKQKKTFWETVIAGDAKIDTGLVDSRRNISTYDEATQAQIRKIMFDQQQQCKGLPTSDELSGVKPIIPPLPPGVEYIDQAILDGKMNNLGK